MTMREVPSASLPVVWRAAARFVTAAGTPGVVARAAVGTTSTPSTSRNAGAPPSISDSKRQLRSRREGMRGVLTGSAQSRHVLVTLSHWVGGVTLGGGPWRVVSSGMRAQGYRAG